MSTSSLRYQNISSLIFCALEIVLRQKKSLRLAINLVESSSHIGLSAELLSIFQEINLDRSMIKNIEKKVLNDLFSIGG